MSTASSLLQGLSEAAVWRLEAACCRFEEAWLAGGRPAPWDFLGDAGEAERLALLRELLRLDVFYRLQAGEGPSLADYRARLPEDEAVVREALGGLSDPPLDETIDGPASEPRRPAVEPSAEGRLVGRYRLLRFHARGGLGEVHVAEDTELSREVALKQMQEEHAADPERRSRFVLEGEVTGGLEHPGVVPVYGRGTQADGRPFYTMRFVRGDTLAAAVARFHAETPGRFDSMEFRQLLGRFVAVCQAVAYAHSRGVLHRDLKPGNVMLGPFGETLVLDWGLAKVLGRAEGDPGAVGQLRPAGPEATATVGAVGTPAYMSPEQATCQTGQLGPATDVYGLGATLYEMLTGSAPLRGNLYEVLSKAVAGAWLPPGEVNRAVPPALDAVCRKAMASRPDDRYGSALELAKEIEAWLADEPVAAYPEPWGTRLRRWGRKNPGRVSGAVVLLGAAVVGLTLGTVLLERSKRQAEDSYKIARQGVNHFLTEVSENVLLDEPGMQGLRQSLLNEALNYHEGFLKIRPNDPAVLQQLAETYRLRGGLDGEVGRLLEGKACLARAVTIYEGLLKTRPESKDLLYSLARCWLWLADIQLRSDETGAGTETVSRAIEVLSALREREPGRLPVLHLLARCHDLRATAKARDGDLGAALRENQVARTTLGQTTDVSPVATNLGDRPRPGSGEPAFGEEAGGFSGVPQSYLTVYGSVWHRLGGGSFLPGSSVVGLVARVLANEGALLGDTGRTAESARSFYEAADLLEWLAEQHPRGGRFRHARAVALLGAGHAEVELGRPATAEAELRKAVALLEKACEQDPLVKEYKGSLWRAGGLLGECLYARGQHRAAAALLRAAVVRGEELWQDTGMDRQLLPDYPRFLCVLGRLEADGGRVEEGVRRCQKAAQLLQHARDLTPGNPALQSGLLRAREALSQLRRLAGAISREDRIREQKQVLDERAALVVRDPQAPRWRGEASRSAAALAGLLLEAGRPREALELVERALPPHEALLREDLERWKEGRSEVRVKRQAKHYFSHMDVGIAPRPPALPSLEFRSCWADLLTARGAALAALGQGASAGACVAKAITVGEEIAGRDCCLPCPPWSWPSAWAAVAGELVRQRTDSVHLLDLARHLAVAPAESGIPDPGLRAVQALSLLAASGFDNPHLLRADGRLAPLRGRPDFDDLLNRLQTPTAAPRGP